VLTSITALVVADGRMATEGDGRLTLTFDVAALAERARLPCDAHDGGSAARTRHRPWRS
jgi:hypothetical protein